MFQALLRGDDPIPASQATVVMPEHRRRLWRPSHPVARPCWEGHCPLCNFLEAMRAYTHALRAWDGVGRKPRKPRGLNRTEHLQVLQIEAPARIARQAESKLAGKQA